MSLPVEFTTARLRLRQWRAEDRAPYSALCSDPEVMRYFPSIQSRQTCDKSIDIWKSEIEQRGWSNWAVELLSECTFIGFVGLSIPKRALPFMPCVEIGYRLAKEYWGLGYATEASREALRVGFSELKLGEIVSSTALVYLPTRKVMERIGMVNSGEDFDHLTVPEGSELRRHCLYRLTRECWSA